MTIENLLLNRPAHYGTTPPVSESLWSYEREQLADRQEWADDLSDVLDEAGVQILDAIRTGNAELVGRVVLAARNANLDRRADRVVGLDPDAKPGYRPTPDIAALRVLLAASIEVTQ